MFHCTCFCFYLFFSLIFLRADKNLSWSPIPSFQMNERRGEAWPGPHSQQGLCIIPAISGSITNHHRLSKLIRYRLSWVCRLAGCGQVALAWGLVPFLCLERCRLLDQWGLLGHHPPPPHGLRGSFRTASLHMGPEVRVLRERAGLWKHSVPSMCHYSRSGHLDLTF